MTEQKARHRSYSAGYQAGYKAGFKAGRAIIPTANELVEQMRREVEWYRTHGRWPKRIGRTSDGHEYVIGDAAWRSRGYSEEIESAMAAALGDTPAEERP
jgi:hypothetical protein